MTATKPEFNSMEGMIWNANHVLDQAMKPGYNGISPKLFQACKGLVLLTVLEAGFIFSGNVGTGIILAKKPDNSGGWSVPCACGLTGVGWGFLVGASMKDIFIFLMNEESLESVLAETGLKLGAQAEVTLGPFGRTAKFDVNVSGRGVGGSVAIAFSRGAFLGLNIEGAVVGARNTINTSFYGTDESPRNIVLNERVSMPQDKVTVMDEVYRKLTTLSTETEAVKVETEAEWSATAESANEGTKAESSATS
ncbi:hypothetical protein ACA910_021839 [Epithemia clementina (nom. ined.)]